MLIPTNNVVNYEKAVEVVENVIKRHVEEIVRVTMSRGEVRYSERVTQELKLAFCEGIDKVVA